ncbi:hypothetical protein LTR51_001382 [Lithohypha guttulata]|nr:hypothetical protein LTR51_001382 [Lithohypha guttulata]
MTSLAICCYHGLASVVEALPKPISLEQATQLDIYEALSLAIHEGHGAVVQALISIGISFDTGPVPSVYVTVASPHAYILSLLLEKGANPNRKGERGSALNLAVMVGNEEHVRMLLKYNANPGLGDTKYGHPLLNAASGGWTEIVKLLLAHGAEAGLYGSYCCWGFQYYGKTHALIEASSRGHLDTLSVLLQAADRESLHEGFYEEAYYAVFSQDHASCALLIKVAAEERGFAAISTRYAMSSSSPIDEARQARLKGMITVPVKRLTGLRNYIQISKHAKGIVLKQATEQRGEFPSHQMAFIVLRTFPSPVLRPFHHIRDEERLCDIGMDGDSVEVTFKFKATCYWVEDSLGIKRALRLSAQEAQQHEGQRLIR